MTLTFTQRLPLPPQDLNQSNSSQPLILLLTAEERTRSRQLLHPAPDQPIYLHLPRGTTLQDGDWLSSDLGAIAQVQAKPEPVLTVSAPTPLDLLQAAYHLGNRHVPLEITPTHLRLGADPVLHHLLEHRGLQVLAETVPFYPEAGAYGHTHDA